MKEKLYKITGLKAEAIHGGSGEWHKPKGKRPGNWMPFIADIEPCERGYHLCRVKDLIEWMPNEGIVWEVEYKGELIEEDDKVVVQQARLVRKICEWDFVKNALFIADCAEHVEHIYAKHTNNDDNAKKLIQIQRDYANGVIDHNEYSAAWDAARAAASAAASAAARAAASAAASAAAMDAEKEWQTKKMCEYLGIEVQK